MVLFQVAIQGDLGRELRHSQASQTVLQCCWISPKIRCGSKVATLLSFGGWCLARAEFSGAFRHKGRSTNGLGDAFFACEGVFTAVICRESHAHLARGQTQIT